MHELIRLARAIRCDAADPAQAFSHRLRMGLLVAAFTGWWIAVLVIPVAAVGLPVLIIGTPERSHIERMEAMGKVVRISETSEGCLSGSCKSCPEGKAACQQEWWALRCRE